MSAVPEKLVNRRVIRDDGSVPFTSPPSCAADASLSDQLVRLSQTAALIAVAAGKVRNVRVATTANGTMSTAFANGQTVDGVTIATGDRILLKNQTTGSENGLYVVNASGAPTRATDADSDSDLRNALVVVAEGTANGHKLFWNTNASAITVETTSITYAAAFGALSMLDTVGTSQIDYNAVTNAKAATMAQSTLKGRAAAAGTGDPTDLTDTQVRTLLGLGALALLNTLDVELLVDGTVGGAGADGAILYWRSGTLRSSSEPPGANYRPVWDGDEYTWVAEEA